MSILKIIEYSYRENFQNHRIFLEWTNTLGIFSALYYEILLERLLFSHNCTLFCFHKKKMDNNNVYRVYSLNVVGLREYSQKLAFQNTWFLNLKSSHKSCIVITTETSVSNASWEWIFYELLGPQSRFKIVTVVIWALRFSDTLQETI